MTGNEFSFVTTVSPVDGGVTINKNAENLAGAYRPGRLLFPGANIHLCILLRSVPITS